MAARAVHQVRLLAVVLLVAATVGEQVQPGRWSSGLAVPAALSAAVLLAAVTVVQGRAWVRSPRLGKAVALVGAGIDAAVVLGVVAAAGPPPRSMAVALLALPLLEAALWAGLAGLGVMWTACAVASTGYALAATNPGAPADVATLLVALAVLLFATIPLGVLAEHLVAEVTRLRHARQIADDRAALLGDLTALTADLSPLQVDAAAAALVTGARQLGASAATISAGSSGTPVVIAAEGAPALLATLQQRPNLPRTTPGSSPASPARERSEDDDGQVVLTWPLELPSRSPYVLRALLDPAVGPLDRRVEALDVLVAHARVALGQAALVEDLAALKRTYEDQAARDQLTGLVNRRGLAARVQAMTGQLGVLFCDLDGFKAVNDTLGHAAGDELLCQVARRLESAVGARGVLGRVGGDEFVVVLPAASLAELADFGRSLEDHVAPPYRLAAGPARIGVSVGAAHARSDSNLDEVLATADQQMYEAKRERRSARVG